MNSSQQRSEPVAPRVSIVVENGGVGGGGAVPGLGRGGSSSSATHGDDDGGGIGGLRVGDDASPSVQEGGMSPGSDLDGLGSGGAGPTAIPADEGDVSASAAAKAPGSGGGATPRGSEAANVTKEDEDDEEEEEDKSREGEDDAEDDAEDDESDYSYTYEDEDEGHYSGFLIPTDPVDGHGGGGHHGRAASAADDDGDVDVVASEECAAASAATGAAALPIRRAVSRLSDAGIRPDSPPADAGSPSSSAVPETNPDGVPGGERKQRWREPTRAAVNMSLRAEKETTGGRRRLASDLYKIMMADTEEAGFSLEPSDEDSMDKWRIKLFGFDEDSNLAKDLMVCGMDHVELEMSFPDQYPFEPPFVRVVAPRFKRQTGFVMSGALCMELLTKDGWNPINDIESVIVSIRSLMVVGDGRLQAASDMSPSAYRAALEGASRKKEAEGGPDAEDASEAKAAAAGWEAKRKRVPSADGASPKPEAKKSTGGSYSAAEAVSAYDHLSKYHKKEGWDKSGWWSRKG